MCAAGGLLCQNLGGQGHPLPHMCLEAGAQGHWAFLAGLRACPGLASPCPCLGRAWGRGREPDLAEVLRSEALPLENQRFP